jgi:hypothetical protein
MAVEQKHNIVVLMGAQSKKQAKDVYQLVQNAYKDKPQAAPLKR